MILVLAYIAASALTGFYLRHRWAWAQRLNDANWQAWVLADIAAAFVLFWPLYIAGVLHDRPASGQTISTYLGRNAAAGRRWALAAARIIDALFRVLTSQRNHCAKSYARWANPLETCSE